MFPSSLPSSSESTSSSPTMLFKNQPKGQPRYFSNSDEEKLVFSARSAKTAGCRRTAPSRSQVAMGSALMEDSHAPDAVLAPTARARMKCLCVGASPVANTWSAKVRRQSASLSGLSRSIQCSQYSEGAASLPPSSASRALR